MMNTNHFEIMNLLCSYIFFIIALHLLDCSCLLNKVFSTPSTKVESWVTVGLLYLNQLLSYFIAFPVLWYIWPLFFNFDLFCSVKVERCNFLDFSSCGVVHIVPPLFVNLLHYKNQRYTMIEMIKRIVT